MTTPEVAMSEHQINVAFVDWRALKPAVVGLQASAARL
jgi:hypothetical protein